MFGGPKFFEFGTPKDLCSGAGRPQPLNPKPGNWVLSPKPCTPNRSMPFLLRPREAATKFAYFVGPIALGATQVVGHPVPRTASDFTAVEGFFSKTSRFGGGLR